MIKLLVIPLVVLILFSSCNIDGSSGENTAPEASTPTFSGDISTIGNEITAQYVFTDADGDSEGNSAYQWFIETTENSGEYIEISGETEISYTTVPLDENLRLKFEVTPVDDEGLAGNTVLSNASGKVGVINTAPTASFATWDYEVSGADAAYSNVNGNYYLAVETSFAKASYSNSSGYELFYASDTAQSPVIYFWAFDDDTVVIGNVDVEISEIAYYKENFDDYPPDNDSWMDNTENSSSLSVVSVPFSGDTSGVGNQLTAYYVFSDTDGDNEGTSLYQWYRSDSEDGVYSAISNATGVTYTTTDDDNEMFLKFEVTPVDEHGLEGTSVLSEATPQIGTT